LKGSTWSLMQLVVFKKIKFCTCTTK
jgi:hypothetical protein